MRVLNRTSGMFKVPTGATGLYLFTFSVTMDTADLNTTEPSEYEFVKNGMPIPGTRIYSDAGVRRPGHGQTGIYDMVSGSNTILLKLEEDDEVGVKQLEDTDIPDYSVTFCGTLIHLDKASESSGGLGADVHNLDFPSSWEAAIVTIDDTQTNLDELGNLTNTRVSRIDTKLTDILDINTLTAYDSDNWRS